MKQPKYGACNAQAQVQIKFLYCFVLYCPCHGRIQRGGGTGVAPLPLKNHKKIGFLSNTGPDPLKNHKTT